MDEAAYSVNMLPRKTFSQYWLSQREKKVIKMGAPIDKIRGMSATQLLNYCGQSDAIPVNLDAILEKIGISALPRDFSETERSLQQARENNEKVHILGATVINGENAAIFYNQEVYQSSHRCRFTIAHELGHCCMSNTFAHDDFHIDYRIEGQPDTVEEKAANTFAGELLIPEKSLEKICGQLLLPSVYILAKIFDVSEAVMSERLKYLRFPERIVGYNY